MNEKVSAVLVNHAEPAEREQFARWLQAHPRSAVQTVGLAQLRSCCRTNGACVGVL